MSVFAIADLHLPFGIKKPMDIFGCKWENYTDKIKENWEYNVKKNDLVIIPGDISWATYLEQTYKDFLFINNLPGEKVIIKGNHDYWWTTMNKLNNYLKESEFNTIHILNNNCYIYENIGICGTRGWINIHQEGKTEERDKKIYLRELQRLELSIKDAIKNNVEKIIVALHYPPIYKDSYNNEFVSMLKEYNVNKCIYGHLHGNVQNASVRGIIEGIEYELVSCDFINFVPLRII